MKDGGASLPELRADFIYVMLYRKRTVEKPLLSNVLEISFCSSALLN